MRVYLGFQRHGLLITKFPFPAINKSNRLNRMISKIPSSFQMNRLIKHYENGQLFKIIYSGKRESMGKRGGWLLNHHRNEPSPEGSIFNRN